MIYDPLIQHHLQSVRQRLSLFCWIFFPYIKNVKIIDIAPVFFKVEKNLVHIVKLSENLWILDWFRGASHLFAFGMRRGLTQIEEIQEKFTAY